MINGVNISIEKVIQYGGPFIIFLGVTKLIVFYASFGVNVLPFLEFSEIITSFFDVILISVISFCISMLLQVFVASNNEISRSEIMHRYFRMRKMFFVRLIGYLYINYVLLVNFIVYSAMLWGIYFLFDFLSIQIVVISQIALLGLLVVLILFLEVKRVINNLRGFIYSIEIVRYVFLGSIVWLVVIFAAKFDAEEIKSMNRTYGTIVIWKDSTKIISDSSYYFIGKTNGYLYFYNDTLEVADIFPIESMAKLTTARRKSYISL